MFSLEELDKIRKQRLIKKRRRQKKFFRAICFMFIIFCFIITGLSYGIYFGMIKNSGSLKNSNIMPNIYTSVIYDRFGDEFDKINAIENREYITLDNISKNLQNAFIAIEDERFYSHIGVDPKGLFRAIIFKITKNKTQGASTITQQLIKNTVTKVSRNNIKTKIKEQYLALKLERNLVKEFGSKKLAKDHILEVYLNTIYLYHGLNGVKTAANYYFDKEPSDLNLAESAVIAAITNSPTYYAPDINPENNNERKNIILKKMLDLNFICQEEYEAAKLEDVYSRISQTKKIKDKQKTYHSYFVDKLIKDITKDLQDKNNLSKSEAINLIYNGGLKIYSSIDPRMQKIMDNKFNDDNYFPKSDYELDIYYYLTKLDNNGQEQNFERRKTVKNKSQVDSFINQEKNNLIKPGEKILADKIITIPQPQAAMIIIDYRTGEVRAITGGRGQKSLDFSLNRATDSERQPGSVFKILASFAPAIDLKKATAATIINDAPFTTPDGYSPKNYYKNYRGPSTIRDAIRDSMNIVSVKNMINTGVDNCFDYLLKFGFTTLVDNKNINGKIYTDKVASTALGGLTHGVNQLEVTEAFGTIANLGEYNKPVFYTKILDHHNNILLENKLNPVKVLEPESAYILTNMMQDVVTKGTGTKAKFNKSKMPIAGKTGTTTDTKDLTFVGYTPYYAAGIWLGFDQPKTMKEDRGYHLKLWSAIMEEIHNSLGLEIKNFDKPEGLVSASICKKTGLLASNSCRSAGTAVTELFINNTQPKKFCSGHSINKSKSNNNNNNDRQVKTTPETETKKLDDQEKNYDIDNNNNNKARENNNNNNSEIKTQESSQNLEPVMPDQ